MAGEVKNFPGGVPRVMLAEYDGDLYVIEVDSAGRLRVVTEAGLIKRMFCWFVPGSQVVGAEKCITYHLDQPYAAQDVWLHVKTAPTGAALIVDINLDGVTIFTTRPQIDDAAETGGDGAVFSVTALTNNSELTMDVDQIGSSVAGADLTVILEAEVA